MKNFLIRLLVGSKLDTMYSALQLTLAGYKTYLVGAITILSGVAQLIDAMQGTQLGDVLALARHPGVEQITIGLGMMTLRAGIEKNK